MGLLKNRQAEPVAGSRYRMRQRHGDTVATVSKRHPRD